jgi:Protein of unknown function with HXXEE motif
MRSDWFLHNWMYAGFLAGLFLLAIAPVFAAAVGLPLLLVYLQLPVYMLHQLEEHYDDRFRKYVNDLVAGGREALSTPAVVVINVVGVWVVILIVLYLARFVGLGLGLIAIYLTLVNALVHIVQAAVQRRYNPGLATAVVLFLPVGIWGLMVVSDTPGVTTTDHLVGLAVAILINATLVAYIKHRAAALSAA